MAAGEGQTDEAAVALSAMSNSQRLTILRLLSAQEMSVGEINQHVDLSQSALSQHLAVLRDAKLVESRRQSQVIYYSVTSILALKILEVLDSFFASELPHMRELDEHDATAED